MFDEKPSVNIYYEGEESLSIEDLKLLDKLKSGKELTEEEIKKICAKWLVNKFYKKWMDSVKKGADHKKAKKKALAIAAKIILKYGKEIKFQLKQNSDIKKSLKLENNSLDKNSTKKQETPSKQDSKDVANNKINNQKLGENQPSSNNKEGNQINNENQGNTIEDVKTISGKTMSEVLEKINEILSGQSKSEIEKMSQNFSDLFDVLASEDLMDKFKTSIEIVGENKLLAASIKDFLSNTSGEKIFNDTLALVANHEQISAINSVSKEDLAKFRSEVDQNRKMEEAIDLDHSNVR